jgi:hypothetical protein
MLYIAKRQVRMHDAKATEISAKTISSIVKLLIITLARYYLVNLFVNISLFGVCWRSALAPPTYRRTYSVDRPMYRQMCLADTCIMGHIRALSVLSSLLFNTITFSISNVPFHSVNPSYQIPRFSCRGGSTERFIVGCIRSILKSAIKRGVCKAHSKGSWRVCELRGNLSC